MGIDWYFCDECKTCFNDASNFVTEFTRVPEDGCGEKTTACDACVGAVLDRLDVDAASWPDAEVSIEDRHTGDRRTFDSLRALDAAVGDVRDGERYRYGLYGVTVGHGGHDMFDGGAPWDALLRRIWETHGAHSGAMTRADAAQLFTSARSRTQTFHIAFANGDGRPSWMHRGTVCTFNAWTFLVSQGGDGNNNNQDKISAEDAVVMCDALGLTDGSDGDKDELVFRVTDCNGQYELRTWLAHYVNGNDGATDPDHVRFEMYGDLRAAYCDRRRRADLLNRYDDVTVRWVDTRLARERAIDVEMTVTYDRVRTLKRRRQDIDDELATLRAEHLVNEPKRSRRA